MNDQDICLQIRYKKNKWVHMPYPGAYLYVFDTFEAARDFVSDFNDECIYRVEVKNPHKRGLSIFTFGYLTEAFRAKKNKKKFSHWLKSAPRGTVGVEAVKLLERVY
jgi:hypothetical protein